MQPATLDEETVMLSSCKAAELSERTAEALEL